MTQCTQSGFEFEAHFSRRVVAGFDGGAITSDAGALLLRQVDRRIGLLPRLAQCFTDFRNPFYVTHDVAGMVSHQVTLSLPKFAFTTASVHLAGPLAADGGDVYVPDRL